MMSIVDQRFTDQIMHASLLTSFFSIWREDKNHTKLQISFMSFEKLKIAIFTNTCSAHSSLQGFSSLPFDPCDSSWRRCFKEFSIGDASKIPSKGGTHEALPLTEELQLPEEKESFLGSVTTCFHGRSPHLWAALNGLDGLFNNSNKMNNNKKT